VPEDWVVSVDGEWIEVYRSPEGDGYRECRRPSRGDHISPEAFGEIRIDVGDVFT
jgi:hypothetical protein